MGRPTEASVILRSSSNWWQIIARKKPRSSPLFPHVKELFDGMRGLEIGGPSGLFNEYYPIYPIAAAVDGCNFSSRTMWEGKLHEGENFSYGDRVGHQYILDAVDLNTIPSGSYDFIISSNCLEHVGNTIKAVVEWLRVLKSGGAILIAVPNKRYYFDRKRPDTTMEHVLNDHNADIDEHDLTHLEEIVRLHDYRKDRSAGSPDDFRRRSMNNFENRCLHHHIFSMSLLEQIADHCGIRVIALEERLDLTLIGQKR
ncbi:MAG: methyltransferase domain-containing protein [Spirochaetota bacterium]